MYTLILGFFESPCFMEVNSLFTLKELRDNDHFNKGEVLIKHRWGKSMWKMDRQA
jgi:hypothetical protein